MNLNAFEAIAIGTPVTVYSFGVHAGVVLEKNPTIALQGRTFVAYGWLKVSLPGKPEWNGVYRDVEITRQIEFKPATWKETTEARYWEMLEVLPPEVMTGRGFLVGEPFDHGRCKVTGHVRPRFAAFLELEGKFFEAAAPMTIAEFRAVKIADVKEAA